MSKKNDNDEPQSDSRVDEPSASGPQSGNEPEMPTGKEPLSNPWVQNNPGQIQLSEDTDSIDPSDILDLSGDE